MKKLKRERKKFNRDYLRPLFGCGILFVLIVVFLIIFGYNPTDKEDDKKTVDNYHLNLDDKTVSQNETCDTTFYKSVIDEVNKVDLSFKVTTVDGEQAIDDENSTEDEVVYFTRKYYAYEMSMNNLPDGVKAVVTDNKTENIYNVNKNEKKFTSKFTSDKVLYTVNIYGDSDNCKDVLLRQFNFTTPVINRYSQTVICSESEDSNCNLITYEETDISNVVKKKMEETIKEEETKKSNTLKIIIGSVLIVIIIAVVIFIYFKRRRKRMVM